MRNHSMAKPASELEKKLLTFKDIIVQFSIYVNSTLEQQKNVYTFRLFHS